MKIKTITNNYKDNHAHNHNNFRSNSKTDTTNAITTNRDDINILIHTSDKNMK